MPDFQPIVRERLQQCGLSPLRESEIVSEVAQHMRDRFDALRSQGIPEEEAAAMIVAGFIEPIVKELPMEYAVEMNRLIQLQMEGSVG